MKRKFPVRFGGEMTRDPNKGARFLPNLHIGERSGKRFTCLNAACRWGGDADLNGARNIALLGCSLNAPHGPWLCCSYQPGRRALEIPPLQLWGSLIFLHHTRRRPRAQPRRVILSLTLPHAPFAPHAPRTEGHVE